MAEKAQKIYFQTFWTGKVYDTEEEAVKANEGPVQPFISTMDRYPKKGFFGTVTGRKGEE
jgi:hypothetical protein